MDRRGFLNSGLVFAGSLLIPGKGFSLENIVGNVKDILTEKPVENARVKLSNYLSGEFIAEYTTDSNGDYIPKITGIRYNKWADIKRLFQEGSAKKSEKRTETEKFVEAEITHSDYQDAVRYFYADKKNFDAAIVDKNFDMNFFDAWARGGKKPLTRWVTNPKCYINPTNAEQSQINLASEIISNDLPEFSGGFINPIIEITEEPHGEEKGNIYVYWIEKGGYDKNYAITTENNKINSVTTWFLKANRLRRVYLRQFTQILGMVNYPSNMEFYTQDGHYTQQGLDCGKFLYNSKPGNISPDTEPVPVL